MSIFKKILLSWIFLYSLFAIVILGSAYYLVLGQGIEDTVSQQLLNRTHLIARAEVGNITSFFERFGNLVATLAQLSSIEDRDTKAEHDLDMFMEQRREAGLVRGIVLTDKNGIVQLHSSVLENRDIGKSLSDRDYFIWAKDQGAQGEYFISQPFISRVGASQGQTVVAVASPVYQKDQFSGVVVASVPLETLAERFFELMKISPLTEVYLVDKEGQLLHSNAVPDRIGANISELFPEDQVLSDKIKNALAATEGDQFQTKKRLVAYSPVIIGVQSWLLIIISPNQEVANYARPLYIQQTSLFVLTTMTILLLGAITARKRKRL